MKTIDFKVDGKYEYLRMSAPTVIDGVRTPNIERIVFQCLFRLNRRGFSHDYLFKDEKEQIYICRRSISGLRSGAGLFNMENFIELRENDEVQTIFVPLDDVLESFRKLLKDEYLEFPSREYTEAALKLIEELKCNTK